jgi:peptidyl-prolyl cis-trans isomerase D
VVDFHGEKGIGEENMLDFMRKQAGSWLIKGLLAIIVIVFVFWGVGSFRSRQANRVALVNGEVITVQEYQESYNSLVEQLKSRLGNNLNEETLKTLGLKKRALDRLIDRRLLAGEAEKLKFTVTDEELTGTIGNIKAFHSDGRFNKETYERVLSRNHMTPEEFESSVRESLMIERVGSFVTGEVKVSENEALEWFKWKNGSVNVDFVSFEPEKYNGINPSQEEIKAFFDKKKENYKTEEKVKVNYLLFDYKAYSSKVKVDDSDVKEFYESNMDKFRRPKTVEASHILFKIDEGAGPAVIEDKRKKADDVLKMIKAGQPFGELAKKYSDCPSKTAGGNLGAFERKDMVEPFAGKSFSMKPGEISEPVLTQFGWHIIKVDKINEEKVFSLKEIESGIRKKIAEDKTKKLAYSEAEAVYDEAAKVNSLAKAAEKQGLILKTTGLFSKNDVQRAAGTDIPSLIAAGALDLSEKEISDVKDIGSGYTVFEVIEKIPPKTPDLKDVKEAVTADLVREKQEEKAGKEAETLLADLKKGGDMRKESARYGISQDETGFFTRNENMGKIGYEPELADTAFKLSKDKPYSEKPVRGKKGYYLLKFKERKDPDAALFEKEKESLIKTLLEQKKLKTFEAWLAGVKSGSKVMIEKEFQE